MFEVAEETLEGSEGSLRSKVISGVAWSSLASFIGQLTRIVTGILLARLLTPAEYGLAGMALLSTAFVLIFSDLSMGAALVQRPKVTEKDLSTVFWTSVMVGSALTIGGVAAAGPIANFFHQPDVKPLFEVISLSFIFIGLQTTQAAIFQREMKFRLIAMRVSLSTIIAGIVGVVCAFMGLGAWALIIQGLAGTIFATAFLWAASPWRPRFMFSITSLRDLGGFGLNVLGSHLIGYAHRNADNLLIGRYLGSAALGAYSVAYNIML